MNIQWNTRYTNFVEYSKLCVHKSKNATNPDSGFTSVNKCPPLLKLILIDFELSWVFFYNS